MKISNIFKKQNQKNKLNKIEVLNNSQLEKVIGGADTIETEVPVENSRTYKPGQVKWGNVK
ncbi:MAG: hypothetical protein U0W65_06990 [Bacteroidia bacterium]|nr:hypothetical protein [Bacteroidia bacterium]